MSRIVWLASYPKSGNTWTRVFLLNLFMNPSKPLSINELAQMSPSDVATDWYLLCDTRPPDQWGLGDVAKLRSKVQEEIASKAPDSIFVKTHCPLLPWQGTHAFNMQVTAGAVCIVRNPLDVVASYASHSGLSCEAIIKVMAQDDYVAPGDNERVAHPIGSWSQNVASWTATPHPAMHVMRYEDMVEKPAEAFAGLVAFLKLPPDADRLEKAIAFSSFDEVRNQEGSTGFSEASAKAERFFRGGKTGGWRRELTPEQVQAVVDGHRVQMARFDYVPEGY